MMDQIETQRLIIRNFQEDDWQDMYEYFSDPKVLEFEPYLPFSKGKCKEERKSNVRG